MIYKTKMYPVGDLDQLNDLIKNDAVGTWHIHTMFPLPNGDGTWTVVVLFESR
jgi:hypothetical protein